MNVRALRAPGLAFEAVRPPPEPSALRSDIAAFACATRRGSVGLPVRVEGWREYCREFGALDERFDGTYAIRGYFENGGEVAWIVRLAPDASPATSSTGLPALSAVFGATIALQAASPGTWCTRCRVKFTYRGRTASGKATVDVEVRTDDEREDHRGIVVGTHPAPNLDLLVEHLERESRLVHLRRVSPAVAMPQSVFLIEEAVLDQPGTESVASHHDYLSALDLLRDVPEPALVSLPDLHEVLDEPAARDVYRVASDAAEELRDRLVLVDLPRISATRPRWHVDTILAWLDDSPSGLRRSEDVSDQTRAWRAAGLYHPWIRVADPLGGVARPTRDIPASGHVAGVISRLDRDRGAHSTPANSPMVGVLDLVEEYMDDEHAVINAGGVDLLRCVPSLGFSVWGGRTLDRTKQNRFVAHRRLIHRLVRAIRRVAEPLVFETNGPALWFAFVRAVTAVLIEAWRAGALAGARPAEAFNIVCDATTNPPEEVDLGRCVCTIEIAPAVPMEFILIRVALSRDGSLEVLS